MKFIAHWGKVSTLIPETGGNMYRCVEHSIRRFAYVYFAPLSHPYVRAGRCA
jgi:hypothetical protein